MCFLADLASLPWSVRQRGGLSSRAGGRGGREGRPPGPARSAALRGARRQVPAGGRSAPLGPGATRSGPRADLREDVVDADDAVRAGRAAVVHDGGVALHPHPAAVLGQEAVVLGGHLPFHQHCGDKAGRASARLPPPF